MVCFAEALRTTFCKFLRRYWFGESLKSIAKIYRLTPADVANRMYRLRQELKAELKREGLFL